MTENAQTLNEQEAIAAWNAALDRIEDQPSWIAAARQAIIDAGLVFQGTPACRVARPRLMAADQMAVDERVITAATTALLAAGRRLLADHTLRRACLGGWVDDGPFADLFYLDPGYSPEIVFGRFDGVRRADGLQLIEFNGGVPGGAAPNDLTAGVMQAWSPFRSLAERYTVEVPAIGPCVIASLLDAWHDFGGTGSPFVVFAVPNELKDRIAPGLRFFLALAARQGLETVMVDPGELTRQAGALWLGDRRVEVVVRVFFTSMLASLGERIEPLMAAVRAGEVCMATSIRSGLYGHKSLFAVITDPDIALDLPVEQRQLAMQHIPWTRVLADRETTGPEGDRVKLLQYAGQHRAELVLKPADGTGGAGVVLGWETAAEPWRDALHHALGQGVWILQGRVPLTTEAFPLLEPGFPKVAFQDDHNPIVCNGRIAGYMVRLSATSGITNLSTGTGSVTAAFLVSGRSSGY